MVKNKDSKQHEREYDILDASFITKIPTHKIRELMEHQLIVPSLTVPGFMGGRISKFSKDDLLEMRVVLRLWAGCRIRASEIQKLKKENAMSDFKSGKRHVAAIVLGGEAHDSFRTIMSGMPIDKPLPSTLLEWHIAAGPQLHRGHHAMLMINIGQIYREEKAWLAENGGNELD